MRLKFSHKISQNQAVNEINKDAKNVLLSPDNSEWSWDEIYKCYVWVSNSFPKRIIVSTYIGSYNFNYHMTFQSISVGHYEMHNYLGRISDVMYDSDQFLMRNCSWLTIGSRDPNTK